MDFKINIGLEFHIQLKTKFKLFSNALNDFSNVPNVNISTYDIGFPGTLPLLNKEAVILAIKAAKCLYMNIDDELHFDRKHYFYSDLTKGYQITQEERPLGNNGKLKLNDGSEIQISRLHIEEDTCKQIHEDEYTKIDFNRSDVPLIEVVTEPTISSALQAKEFAKQLRNILVNQNVTDGKMQEGSFRVDVNISLSKNDELGTKVEIKNINTFENIEKAIECEISRQKSIILANECIKQQTFRYDEKLGNNVLMRDKIDSIDYHCFVDPNIPVVDISNLITTVEILKNEGVKNPLMNLPINIKKCLTNNKELFNFYIKCAQYSDDHLLVAKFIVNDLSAILVRNKMSIENFDLALEKFVLLITAVGDGKISNNVARNILNSIIVEKGNFDDLYSKSINNAFTEKELSDIIDMILFNNNKIVHDYLNGNNRAFGCLIKLVNERTLGQVDLSKVSQIIKTKLEDSKWQF